MANISRATTSVCSVAVVASILLLIVLLAFELRNEATAVKSVLDGKESTNLGGVRRRLSVQIVC